MKNFGTIALFLLFCLIPPHLTSQELTPQERRAETENLLLRGYAFSMGEVDELRELARSSRESDNPELAQSLDFLAFSAQLDMASRSSQERSLFLDRQWERELQRRQDIQTRGIFRAGSRISLGLTLASLAGAFFMNQARSDSYLTYIQMDPTSPEAQAQERDFRGKEVGTYLLTAHALLFAYVASIFEYNTPPEPR